MKLLTDIGGCSLKTVTVYSDSVFFWLLELLETAIQRRILDDVMSVVLEFPSTYVNVQSFARELRGVRAKKFGCGGGVLQQ